MAADPVTRTTVSDLLNYDVSDDEDPFKDIENSLRIRNDKTTLSPRAAKRKAEEDKENDILGLDEEVKIAKKRRPIAKLDEARLLSQPGIPKLRALARSGQISQKLKLKGKGHEFSDAARLLNYFQLWLDNLYPRAKFADGLQLVEKAGHSKRMHVMRKEWIDEGKPGYARDKRAPDEEVDLDEGSPVQPDQGPQPTGAREGVLSGETAARNTNKSIFGNGGDDNSDDLFFPDANKTRDGREDDDDDAPEEDELEALLAIHQTSTDKQRPRLAEPESDAEDDLDALLAEQDSRSSLHRKKVEIREEEKEDEEDDLDALLAEQDSRSLIHRKKPEIQEEDRGNEEDDLDALLAEQETHQKANESLTL